MKLHVKLGLIFSIITMASTLAYSVFFYVHEKASFYSNAKEGLTSLGERMISQFDDYVQVMDYTLENLISNTEFMDAMAIHANPHYAQSDMQWLEASKTMGNVLYRDALNKNYHRVNAFNRGGMLYTSRFDNRDTVNQLTHDIAKIVDSLPWLRKVDQRPFQRVFVPPHLDPWTAGKEVQVFSAVRSIIWMGQHIGYLEVQSREEDLQAIFSPQGLEGVSVSAFINGGGLLYESEAGAAARGKGFLTGEWSVGNYGLYELAFSSDKNQLTLYMAQDTSAWQASLMRFMYKVGITALILQVVILIVIMLVSRRLTKSVRQLEDEISNVQLEDLSLSPPIGLRAGDEIYRLQNAFHALIERLISSIRDEIRLRELHLQARMNALQAQINPHFIYNTLNVINSKSLEYGALDIARLTDRFSEMLRYTTNMHEKTVTLEQELEHAANYLELMKLRYEHKLEYRIDVPDRALWIKLPRLTLQPLVENAILHGYQQNNRVMKISITGRIESGQLVLEVRDNGDGFSGQILQDVSEQARRLYANHEQKEGESVGGVGLMNTLARLYYFSNGKMKFSLFNEDGAVVQISLAE